MDRTGAAKLCAGLHDGGLGGVAGIHALLRCLPCTHSGSARHTHAHAQAQVHAHAQAQAHACARSTDTDSVATVTSEHSIDPVGIDVGIGAFTADGTVSEPSSTDHAAHFEHAQKVDEQLRSALVRMLPCASLR